MFISNAFKNDMLSRNTKIIPIVIIEKYISGGDPYQNPETGEWGTSAILIDAFGFSTNNIELIEPAPVQGVAKPKIYCKPLLMGLPKLKESVDITNGKYRISSVTLNFSNVEYNGSRMSDLFTDNLLINENVSIHLKSESCTTITPSVRNVTSSLRDNDCAVLYVGKIRSATHTDEKVTIKLEDLTEQKIHKDLPSLILGDGADILDKYKNKPVPMVFGELNNAPLVARYVDGKQTFMADYKEIYAVNEEEFFDEPELTASTFIHGALKFYDSSYIDVLKYVQKVFEINEFDENGELNEDYVDFGGNFKQYNINEDNTITIEKSGLWAKDRIQGIYSGKPKNISLIDINHQTMESYETENAYGLGTAFPIELINETDYDNLTDGDDSTYASKNEVTTSWANTVGQATEVNTYAVFTMNLPYSLRWEISPPKSKYSLLLRTTIDGYNLPVRGDLHLPSGYGHWSSNTEQLYLVPQQLVDNYALSLQMDQGGDWNVDMLLSNSSNERISMGDYPAFEHLFSMSANHGLEQDTLSSHFDLSSLQDAGVSYTWNDDALIKFRTKFNLQAFTELTNETEEDEFDCLPVIRFHGGEVSTSMAKAPDNYYCIDFISLHCYSLFGNWDNPWASANDLMLDASIKDIDVFSIIEYDDAATKSYYADVKGRVDSEILSIEHTFQMELPSYYFDFLENPIDIMRHILKEELGITKFNEEEYERAWMTHFIWSFAFSVDKKINSKKLIEEISASTMSFPRLKNNGEFGFVSIKPTYTGDESDEADYINAVEIDINDIIKYDFKLTDPNKIITKIDMQYGYDSGQDVYLKTIKSNEFPFAEASDTLLRFNGIENIDDYGVTLENKHIQSKFTMRNFIFKKFRNESVQHLIIDLSLPLQYSEVEVGTLIKFPKDTLINGLKAYGMDYTNPIVHGTAVRLPLFLITEVQRGLDSISISCYQLHFLADTYQGQPFNHSEFVESLSSGAYGWGEDNFPNGNWVDPAVIDSDFEASPDDFGGNNLIDDASFGSNYIPALNLEFPIGYESQFSINGSHQSSGYSRTFKIIDTNIGTEEGDYYIFDLKSRFESLFGLSAFGISDWDSLIPDKNSDDSGYGSILNGNGVSQVGGFVGMEIKMSSKNAANWYILSLRNIAGTEFDSDINNPNTTIIPETINPSSTELKLGWVLYQSDEEWNYVGINNVDGIAPIDNNLSLMSSAWSYEFNDHFINSMQYEHKMILYPNFIALPNLTLYYGIEWESELLSGNYLQGDFNQDGIVDILDIILIVDIIMNYSLEQLSIIIDGEPQLDLNEDEILDIFDIILLTNIVLGVE